MTKNACHRHNELTDERGRAEQFERIAATVAGTTIPACGHLLAEEQPQAVVAQMLAFAERRGGRLSV